MSINRSKSIFNCLLLLIIYSFLFQSCSKHIDKTIEVPLRANAFFNIKGPLSDNANVIYKQLKAYNEKSHFVEKLPKNAGVPIWEKIIKTSKKQKTAILAAEGKMVNATGNSESAETLIIPLTNDDKYLSSVMIGTVFNDSTIAFNCITNKRLYNKVMDSTVPASVSQKLVGLFMLMDNSCFNTTVFKHIPGKLFPHSRLNLENGKKWVEFQVSGFQQNSARLNVGVNYAYILNYCIAYRNTNGCTCTNKNNCDWRDCPTGACISTECFDIDLGDDGNGTYGGGDGGGSGGGTSGNGNPGGQGDTDADYDPDCPCGGTWYNPLSCSAYDPGDHFRFDFGDDPPIDLAAFLRCFDNVPDAGATYSVTLNAALPNDNDPDELEVNSHPGHAFITMTKTNGSNTVTQSFGFYPRIGRKSISMGDVTSAIKNDGNHKVNASIKMDNILESQFQALQSSAISLAFLSYDLNDFNCTDFALRVFNVIRGTNKITIPNTVGIILNPMGLVVDYGQTPNGLYKFLNANSSSYSNISIGVTAAPASHGACY
jgi:hypothetical protein